MFVCSFLYSLLALWRLRKAYFKKGWIKVSARPNNTVTETSSGGSEGGTTRIKVPITEGWTFTVDGQQYDVRQPSGNHYTYEKEIYHGIKLAIERVNNRLSNIEKIKKFVLSDEPFSLENKQLTPTMKIRRHVIYKNYQDNMEQLYAKR